MGSLLKKIRIYYSEDCCWPYSLSFFLILLIYLIDFKLLEEPYLWPSIVSYAVVFAYFLYNLFLYIRYRGKDFVDHDFFIKFLSVKIVVWGVLLIFLLIESYHI